MSLNHLVSLSTFAEVDGLGGRKEDISVNNLSMESLTIAGYVDVAGSVGIGTAHNNSYQLLVQESTADAVTTKMVGNGSSTSNFLTPSVLQLQNSNNTVDNYESIAFKNSADGISAFISAQNINQSASGAGILRLGVASAGSAVPLITMTSAYVSTSKPLISQPDPAANGVSGLFLTGNAANYGGVGVGRTAEEGSLTVASGADNYFTGTAAGDIILKNETVGKKLWMGVNGGSAVTLDGSNTLDMKGGSISNVNDLTLSTGNVNVSTAGKGLVVKGGAGGRVGLATLVSGSATVTGVTLTANSRIFLTVNQLGGTPGFLNCTLNIPGSSFEIVSSAGIADSSIVAYFIVEQS
jgi:hypothetical protein